MSTFLQNPVIEIIGGLASGIDGPNHLKEGLHQSTLTIDKSYIDVADENPNGLLAKMFDLNLPELDNIQILGNRNCVRSLLHFIIWQQFNLQENEKRELEFEEFFVEKSGNTLFLRRKNRPAIPEGFGYPFMRAVCEEQENEDNSSHYHNIVMISYDNNFRVAYTSETNCVDGDNNPVEIRQKKFLNLCRCRQTCNPTSPQPGCRNLTNNNESFWRKLYVQCLLGKVDTIVLGSLRQLGTNLLFQPRMETGERVSVNVSVMNLEEVRVNARLPTNIKDTLLLKLRGLLDDLSKKTLDGETNMVSISNGKICLRNATTEREDDYDNYYY